MYQTRTKRIEFFNNKQRYKYYFHKLCVRVVSLPQLLLFAFEAGNHSASLFIAHAKSGGFFLSSSSSIVVITIVFVVVSAAASSVSRSRPRSSSSSFSVVVSVVIIVSPSVASVPAISSSSMIRISSLPSSVSSPSSASSISVHPPLLPLLPVPPEQRVRQRLVLNRPHVHKVTIPASRARVLFVLPARAFPKIRHW